MLKIYNIKEKIKYLEEVVTLTRKQWGDNTVSKEDFAKKTLRKIEETKNKLNTKDFAILILLKDDVLVGFISLFPKDGDERDDLTPWYATMYVKEKFRKNGYSKILNDAILEYAKNLGYDKIYLKSDLVNYYEKFGAKYMETLKCGEKLYYITLK